MISLLLIQKLKSITSASNLLFIDLKSVYNYISVFHLFLNTLVNHTLLKIITQDYCQKALSQNDAYLCGIKNFVSSAKFLSTISFENFSDYCLSYTFTARDFGDGTIGSAWMAKLYGYGGVCSRHQYINGVKQSLNSGFVSARSLGLRIPQRILELALAHEIGHNFGSEHDPTDDSICTPNKVNGGKYLMSRTSSNIDKNSKLFQNAAKAKWALYYIHWCKTQTSFVSQVRDKVKL